MRIYLPQTVLEASLDRFRWLFDEFANLIVCVSGGKDSTVIFNLALQVAEEKGRLPLKVMFVDQEAEWEAVIRYMRIIMNDPRVEPLWMQVPIKLFNATSPYNPWLYCWQEGAEWIRPKEAISLKENRYGTDRFAQFFGAYLRTVYPDEPACMISGVRTEESPGRVLGLTSYLTYKHVTWGKKRDKVRGHYDFYPIYDWSYTDVWKAIYSHGWPYCQIYDLMYQYGISYHSMRVSNVHHETAFDKLFFLQAIEGDTWDRLVQRIAGVNTAGKLGYEDYFVYDLPPMFQDWKEYRDYLIKHLISDPIQQRAYRIRFQRTERDFKKDLYLDKITWVKIMKTHVNTILANDVEFTKLRNFEVSAMSQEKRNRYKARHANHC